MRIEHYQAQMNRLAENFGAQHYKRERAELIWQEVRNLSDDWMKWTVDQFIGRLRQAPLLDEFCSAAATEKEKTRQKEKTQERQDAEDFWAGTYQPDDVKMICGMITKRLRGEVSDEDYAQFVKHLEYTAEQNEKTKAPKTFAERYGATMPKITNQPGPVFKRLPEETEKLL